MPKNSWNDTVPNALLCNREYHHYGKFSATEPSLKAIIHLLDNQRLSIKKWCRTETYLQSMRHGTMQYYDFAKHAMLLKL